MIDPKFNELPETNRAVEDDILKTEEGGRPRPTQAGSAAGGLSINDTVAANANLSDGGRGADTSGVRAGAGAGAGTSYMTPGAPRESPGANIAPGPTGSGTTPLSDAATNQRPTQQNAPTSSDYAEAGRLDPTEVASHAYRCWHERGCPEGSPEEDWHRAERELRERVTSAKALSAKA